MHSLQCLESSYFDIPAYHQIWWVRPQVVRGNHDHRCRLSAFGSHFINQLILALKRSSFLRTPFAETFFPVHSVGSQQCDDWGWYSKTQKFNFQSIKFLIAIPMAQERDDFGGVPGASKHLTHVTWDVFTWHKETWKGACQKVLSRFIPLYSILNIWYANRCQQLSLIYMVQTLQQ